MSNLKNGESELAEKGLLGKITKKSGLGPRRPQGLEVVQTGFRVREINRRRFNYACQQLNQNPSEVIERYMEDFWQKYSGEKQSVREEYDALQREATRLFESLPNIRKPMVHWERFKALYEELGGDTEEWRERNARTTLFAIYRKMDSLFLKGSKCPDCGLLIRGGHLDADYRRFDMYITAKIEYAEKDRKLTLLMAILIQQEDEQDDPAVKESEPAGLVETAQSPESPSVHTQPIDASKQDQPLPSGILKTNAMR